MQIFPPSPHHYLPLLLCPLLLLLQPTPAHISSFVFFCLLIASARIFQNYCNLAAAILISPILILQNLQCATEVISEHAQSNFWQMHTQVLSDWRIAAWLFQAILILALTKYCFKKYKEYKEEMNSFSPF